MEEPTTHPEGFAARIERSAHNEADAVMADLARLRFRADQVARVMRALKLPFPDGLQFLLDPEPTYHYPEDGATDFAGTAAAPPETEPEAPPAPPPPPRRPAPPEAPEAEPPSSAAPTPAEPVASAQAAPDAPERTRKSPVSPGPEALPEHLRRMPAASGNGPLTTRIKAAEGQLKVYEDIKANTGSLPPEVADRTELPADRVGHYVRQLEDAGLIERTGRQRLKRGAAQGRVGNEWRVTSALHAVPRPAEAQEAASSVPPQRAGAQEAPADSAPPAAHTDAAPVAQSGSSTSDVITTARNWIVEQGEEAFSPSRFAEAVGVSPEAGMQLLQLFADRGIVEDLSSPGCLLYSYSPPREPGRAAELDRERAKARTAEEMDASRNGSGVPVAGTGRTRWSGDPATQALCERAERAGALVEKGRGHIVIRNAVTRARVIVSSTPSGGNSPDKTKKRLAAIGINI
jgi:hypothetical protein